MIKFKRLKSILLTTSLTLGLSLFISANAYAGTYTTVSGDSLYKISRVFYTSIENLIRDNNLRSTMLRIGQVLYVPADTYTVQKGDTLFIICRKYGISLDTLRRANNIYTDYIYIGQKLNIPKTNSTSSETSTVSAATAPAAPSPAPAPTPAPAPKPAPTPAPTPAPAPAATLSAYSNDLDLLSRLIMAEAQGEPYEAQVAVGEVVVNRTKSGKFPATISGVIYQNINGYYQFTPVVNGWIDKPANETAIRAAKEALSGTNLTNGSLFYYDNTTTNPWILSKQVSVTFGHMIFAY